MNNYITPDNKIWGFDDTQMDLIPSDAIKIPSSFSITQIPFIVLVDNIPTFDQSAYDLAVAKQKEAEQAYKDAKDSALAKLTALGLTQDEIKALIP